MATPLISELRVGQWVRVVDGPFVGAVGQVIREYTQGVILVDLEGGYIPVNYRPEELALR